MITKEQKLENIQPILEDWKKGTLSKPGIIAIKRYIEQQKLDVDFSKFNLNHKK